MIATELRSGTARAHLHFNGQKSGKLTGNWRPALALKNEKADRPDLGTKNSLLSGRKGSISDCPVIGEKIAIAADLLLRIGCAWIL